MARKITIDELVHATEGPKKKVPTYQFSGRVFKEREKPPGQHEKRYDYTIR